MQLGNGWRPGGRLGVAMALVVGLAVINGGKARAADASDRSWEPVLRLQLQDKYNCALEEVLYVRELKLGKDTGLEGRVRCIDQREFDFTRPNVHQKFELRLCLPTVC